MNHRKFAIVLIFVLAAGGAAWWFRQLPAPTSDHPASAEAKSPIAVPLAPGKAPIAVSAPIARSVSPSIPKPTSTMAPTTSAQSAAMIKEELNTTIAGIAALSQSGDMLAVMKTYTSPEELAQIPPEVMTQMERAVQIQAQNPDTQQIYRAMGEAFALLKDQIPEINAAGDEATYQLTVPAGTLPPGMTDPPPRPVTFQKIDGKWYLKRDAGG